MTRKISPQRAVERYLNERRADISESTYYNHSSLLSQFVEWCEDEEIDYDKAPTGQEDHYERLDLHNRDCYWKYRDEIDMPASLDNEYKKHILDSIANKPELTPLQHQKAFVRLFELDLPQFGYRTDAVAFCLFGTIESTDGVGTSRQNVGSEAGEYSCAKGTLPLR